jgi:hypothetical protein
MLSGNQNLELSALFAPPFANSFRGQSRLGCRETKADTLKQLRPIGKGDQELEKRLD